MYPGTLQLIAIFAVIGYGQANICKMPISKEKAIPDNFPETWYVGLRTADPVMHDDVMCSILRNFTGTTYGASMVVHEYHENSDPQNFPVHFLNDDPGLYKVASADAYGIIRSHALAPDGSFNKKALDLDIDYFRSRVMLMTDNENYLVTIFCTHTENFVVWAQFPQPKPKVEQVVKMYNRLDEYGISEKLYFCKDVDFTK